MALLLLMMEIVAIRMKMLMLGVMKTIEMKTRRELHGVR